MLYLAIFLQRLAETFVAMLPSLLTGTVLAGVTAAFVPAGRIRALLGTGPDGVSAGGALGGVRSGVLGALWGVVLPVCAVGLLPVLVVARRAGASRRALAALAVCGGTVQPYTFVYALGLTAPWKLAIVVGAILMTAVIAGWAAGERPARTAPHGPPAGRLAAAALISGHLVLRLVPVYVALTLLGAALMATLLPPGYIGHLFAESDPMHVLIGLAVAVPAYAPPSIAALQVTELLWQQADPGLAVGWWVLAGGMTLGSLLFLPRVLGWSGLLRAAAVTAVLLTLAGFALSPLLRDGPVPSGDSLAFDRHNRPYHHAVEQHGPGAWLLRQARELNSPDLHVCLLGLLLLALTAGLPAAAQSRILTPPPVARRGTLPAPVVTAALTVAAAGVLASLLYAHFPDPQRLLDEARHPDAEILSLLPGGNWDRLDEPLRQLGDRIRRLGPAARLRAASLPDGYREALDAARVHHAALVDAINRRDAAAATDHSLALTRSLRAAERSWSGR